MNPLHLSNQLCFPFYSISKEIIKRYRHILKPLNLTYPQYLVMLVLWEEDHVTLKSIGERLQLDSGTLTPVANKLIEAGYVKKTRNPEDERQLVIQLTERGHALQKEAEQIPVKVHDIYGLSEEEYVRYKTMLDDLSMKLGLTSNKEKC
ncbi:MarR family transcriptional regulator [Jeotgalibacillus sp. S-D1]|uniref:MarR family winged helix-turn-helix transcriptional regulator n=1 Tax=Jeotgalibacillus sp. S-D1 TaxID=2552189 RepID=UPI001059FA47|nr:MarR family transcriptional regulator [Jeotgalibacillus sp. S-D1]TDL31974.1 MarR family transcriptional regulator [Jeotgalibacillus sp. S-D1]